MKLTIIHGAAYRPISLDSAHRHAHQTRVFVQWVEGGPMVDATETLLEGYSSTREWKASERCQGLKDDGVGIFIRVGRLPAEGWLEKLQAAQNAAHRDWFSLYLAAMTAQRNPTAETIAALETERTRFRAAMHATLDHIKNNV